MTKPSGVVHPPARLIIKNGEAGGEEIRNTNEDSSGFNADFSSQGVRVHSSGQTSYIRKDYLIYNSHCFQADPSTE